jgi:hypothetical protein
MWCSYLKDSLKLIGCCNDHKRDNRLFNAFCLSHQELLEKKPADDYEDFRLITEALL